MRKINPKEKMVVKAFLETGHKGKAVEAAGYNIKNKNQRSSYGSKVMQRPVVKRYLEDLLDEQGLSDERIAHKLKKIIAAGTRRGPLKDTSSQTALEAIKFTAKLKDIIPSKKIEQSIDQRTSTLNLNLTAKSEEELNTTLDNLLSEINSFKRKFLKPSVEEAEIVEVVEIE